MTRTHKPLKNSVMIEPRPAAESAPSPENAQDAAYLAQKARDDASIAAREEAREQHDQIGTLLGSNFYVENKGFPWLRYFNAPLTFVRYYPTLKTAVDLFPVVGPNEQKEIDFKREACKKNDIRYGALSYSMDLAALIPQTGIPVAD